MKEVADTKLKRMYKRRITNEESGPLWMLEEIKKDMFKEEFKQKEGNKGIKKKKDWKKGTS